MKELHLIIKMFQHFLVVIPSVSKMIEENAYKEQEINVILTETVFQCFIGFYSAWIIYCAPVVILYVIGKTFSINIGEIFKLQYIFQNL